MSASRSSTSTFRVSTGRPIRIVSVTGRMMKLPFTMAERPPETALFERQKFVGPAARALRKNQKRVAGAQRVGAVLDRPHGRFFVPPIDGDESGHAEGARQE